MNKAGFLKRHALLTVLCSMGARVDAKRVIVGVLRGTPSGAALIGFIFISLVLFWTNFFG